MHDSERYLVQCSTNALDGLGLPARAVCSGLEPEAWLFFVLYMLIVSYLLFNLLVAVVLS